MSSDNTISHGGAAALAHDAPVHGDGAVHVHIASTRYYVTVFAGLIVLTVATVRVSYYDFGSWNAILAVLIATMKASLVAAFFMHLRHDKLFNVLAFLGAFLFLAIFILLTYDDLGTRGKSVFSYTGESVDPRTGEAAPGGAPATSATVNDVAEAPGAPAGGGGAKE